MSVDSKERSPNKGKYRYMVFLEKEQFKELQAKKPLSFTIEPCPELGPKAYTLYSSASDANIMAELSKDLMSHSTKLTMDLLLQIRPDKQRALAKHLLELDPKDAAEILIARDPLIFHQWLSNLDEITKDEQRVGKGTFLSILLAMKNKLEPKLDTLDFLILPKQTIIKKFTAKKLNIETEKVEHAIKKLQSEESYSKESEAALEQTLKFYVLSFVNLDPKKAVEDLFQYEPDIRARLINHLQQLKEKHSGSSYIEMVRKIQAILSLSTQKYIEMGAPSKPSVQVPESSINEQKEKRDEQLIDIKQRMPVDSSSDRKEPLKDIKNIYRYMVFLEKEQFKELQAKEFLSFTIEPCPELGPKAYTLYSSASDANVMAEVGKDLVSYSTKLDLLLQLRPDKQRALAKHLLELDPKDAAEILIARDSLNFHQWLCHLDEITKDERRNGKGTFWAILYTMNKLEPIIDSLSFWTLSKQTLIEKFTAKKLNTEAEKVEHAIKILQSKESYSKENEAALEQTLKFYALSLVNLDPKKAVEDLFQYEPDIRARLINHLQQLKERHSGSSYTEMVRKIQVILSLSTQKYIEMGAPSKPSVQVPESSINEQKEKRGEQLIDIKQRMPVDSSSDRKEPLKDIKNMYRYTVFLEQEQFNKIQDCKDLSFSLQPCSVFGKNAYTLYSNASDTCVAAEVAKDLPLSTKLAEELSRQLSHREQRKLSTYLFKMDPEEAAEILMARDPLICYQWLDFLSKAATNSNNGKELFSKILRAIANKLDLNLDRDPTINEIVAKKLGVSVQEVDSNLKPIHQSEGIKLGKSQTALEQILKHRLEAEKRYSYTIFLDDTQFKELQSKSNLSFTIERSPNFGEKAYTLYSSVSDARVVAEVGKNLLNSPELALVLLPQLMPDKQRALMISHILGNERVKCIDAAGIVVSRDPFIFHQCLNGLLKANPHRCVDILRHIAYKLGLEYYSSPSDAWIRTLTAKKLNVGAAEIQQHLKEIEKNEESYRTESTLVFQQVLESYFSVPTLLTLDPAQAAKTLYECEPLLRLRLVNDLKLLAGKDSTAKEKVDSILEEFYETLINKEKFVRPEEKKRNPHLSTSNSDLENNVADSEESKKNNSFVQIPEEKGYVSNNSRPKIGENRGEDNPPVERNDTVTIPPYLPPQAPTEFLSLEAKIFLGVALITVGGVAGYGSYKLIEHFGKTEAAGQFFSNNYQYLIMAAAITVMLGLTVYCRLRCHNQENDQAVAVLR